MPTALHAIKSTQFFFCFESTYRITRVLGYLHKFKGYDINSYIPENSNCLSDSKSISRMICITFLGLLSVLIENKLWLQSGFCMWLNCIRFTYDLCVSGIIKSSDWPTVRFRRTSTVRFGPNDRTFFCRTQNFFHIVFNGNGILFIFVLLNDPHVRSIIISL